MNITINLELDTESAKDIAVLSSLIEAIRGGAEITNVQPTTEVSYEEAWKQCSWEIIALALAILKVQDGASLKGTYAFFDTLLSPKTHEICGTLTERSISSRVGRTAVICKNLGDFRLMEIAIRRKDHSRRVFVTPDAEDALLKLFHGDWGKDFNNYLLENGLEPDSFEGL